MSAVAPPAAVAHLRNEIARAEVMIADARRRMLASESGSDEYAAARQALTYMSGCLAAFRESLIVLGEKP